MNTYKQAWIKIWTAAKGRTGWNTCFQMSLITILSEAGSNGFCKCSGYIETSYGSQAIRFVHRDDIVKFI